MTRPARLALLSGAALLALAPFAVPAVAGPACAPDEVTVLARSGQVAYRVEIADDPDEQARGLMFRTEMAPDAGMLFIFPDPRPAAFWMKNTILPLDIVFIDAAGRILNIAEHTTPFSERALPSDGDALAVLEVNAGEAARRGFGPGVQVVHPVFADAPPEHRCPR